MFGRETQVMDLLSRVGLCCSTFVSSVLTKVKRLIKDDNIYYNAHTINCGNKVHYSSFNKIKGGNVFLFRETMCKCFIQRAEIYNLDRMFLEPWIGLN